MTKFDARKEIPGKYFCITVTVHNTFKASTSSTCSHSKCSSTYQVYGPIPSRRPHPKSTPSAHQIYVHIPGLRSHSRSTSTFQVYIHVPDLHHIPGLCPRTKSTSAFQVYIHIPDLHPHSRYTSILRLHVHVLHSMQYIAGPWICATLCCA